MNKKPHQRARRSLVGPIFAGFLALAALFGSRAEAEEWTNSVTVQGIQVTASSGGAATFYILSSGWGASGCPTAQWAYLGSDAAGASEILALAMQAKQQGKSVQAYGTCSSGYFNLVALYELS